MSILVAIETLRQNVASVSSKLHITRVEGYHQNSLFPSDQRKFYKQLSSVSEPMDNGFPKSGDIVKFCGVTLPHTMLDYICRLNSS